jgi:hypothetical protein
MLPQFILMQSTPALRAVLAALLFSLLLPGCGPSANAPGAKIAERADVTITVDGKRHACIAALYKEPQGNNIPCADLIPFLKEQLRLPGGSVYDIQAVAVADAPEAAQVAASLKQAGYRFIGGRTVPFAN